jgi:hypothetical protein
MAKKKKPTKTEELVSSAENVISLWVEFRKCFRRAFGSHEITPQEEQHFLEIKSNLSRLQRVLAQRLPEGFKYGSKGITELMAQCVSIASLRELPANDKKGLYQEWHKAFISLQNLRGILDMMEEGHHITFETTQAKSGNLKKDMRGGDKKEVGAMAKYGKTVVTIAIIGAVVWFLYTKSQ